MRFSARRSVSPSPVRRNASGDLPATARHWSTSTFGVNGQSDSNSDDSYDNDDESSSSNGSSEEDSCSGSDDEPHASSSRESLDAEPRRAGQTPKTHPSPTAFAIRLRTRYHDHWDEWERRTRVGAFRAARKDAVEDRAQLAQRREAERVRSEKQTAALHVQKMAEVEAQLAAMQMQQKKTEAHFLAGYKERDKQLWERIESVIKFEEAKAQARLDEEKRLREAAEAKQREEALKAQQEEERKLATELKLKKEQEEAQKVMEKAEQDKKDAEAAETARQARLKAEETERNTLGLTTSEEDWTTARQTLATLKSGPMKIVKSTKEYKTVWMKLRREIVPKIGQLTNDQSEINRISKQLINIVRPAVQHPEPVYYAALSSLAKAILLQAETEVTAEKRAAVPLALVTVNLISSLEMFADIFFAKLVQRSGGWPIPLVVPSLDLNKQEWENATVRAKAHGYKRGPDGEEVETVSEYTTRVAGLLRLYFHILKAPVQQPLPPMFQMPRYWTYFARMVGSTQMLESAVAPQLLYAALDVGGDEARQIWGGQWVKMLALLYGGVTEGIGGAKVIGGASPEGRAARVRVQMEIERIMNQ